jgi:hypothetical protein
MKITIKIVGLPKGAKVQLAERVKAQQRRKYTRLSGEKHNLNGIEHQLYVSDGGKLFIFRKAKGGVKYKFYV